MDKDDKLISFSDKAFLFMTYAALLAVCLIWLMYLAAAVWGVWSFLSWLFQPEVIKKVVGGGLLILIFLGPIVWEVYSARKAVKKKRAVADKVLAFRGDEVSAEDLEFTFGKEEAEKLRNIDWVEARRNKRWQEFKERFPAFLDERDFLDDFSYEEMVDVLGQFNADRVQALKKHFLERRNNPAKAKAEEGWEDNPPCRRSRFRW